MRVTIEPVLALAVKDWRRFTRQPFLVLVSVVMPLVFIFFYSIIVPSSSTAPVVVARDGNGPEATRFLQVLRSIHSPEGPYYEIVTTDAGRARQMFSSGEALGMIVIPAGFDDSLASRGATVQLHLNNINSDYSKNLRLRLDHAVLWFREPLTLPSQRVAVEESAWLPTDPRMQDYISTSLLLFACLYAAMVNTGLQVAGEWNERTIKNLLLAPVSRGTLVWGKIVAGLGQSLLSVLLVALALVTLFGFRPAGSWLSMLGLVLVILLLGAGLGAAIGVASKQTLATTSALIALAIAIFLISGNEDSLRGLAWEGPVAGLWQLSRLLPTTYAFLAARSVLLTGSQATLAFDLLVVLVTTAAVIAGASLLLRRAYSQLPGGQ